MIDVLRAQGLVLNFPFRLIVPNLNFWILNIKRPVKWGPVKNKKKNKKLNKSTESIFKWGSTEAYQQIQETQQLMTINGWYNNFIYCFEGYNI